MMEADCFGFTRGRPPRTKVYRAGPRQSPSFPNHDGRSAGALVLNLSQRPWGYLATGSARFAFPLTR